MWPIPCEVSPPCAEFVLTNFRLFLLNATPSLTRHCSSEETFLASYFSLHLHLINRLEKKTISERGRPTTITKLELWTKDFRNLRIIFDSESELDDVHRLLEDIIFPKEIEDPKIKGKNPHWELLETAFASRFHQEFVKQHALPLESDGWNAYENPL